MKRRILSAFLAASMTASVVLSGCSETPATTSIPPTSMISPTTMTTVPPTTVPPSSEPSEPVTPTDNSIPNEASLPEVQQNSLNMLNYLAVVSEEIRISKNNRLLLEDIYTELVNEINPGSIDEETQDHLRNLLDRIENFKSIGVRRERLEYIHNQDMAEAMHNAVPDPLSVLSISNALDWKRLAITATFTIVDSYNNYKSAAKSADSKYLTSGWALDDYEAQAIWLSRKDALDYMIDITQKYGTNEQLATEFGKLTLNEKAVENYASYIATADPYERIGLLESERDTYAYFGDYWIELADSYFNIGSYQQCLECVQTYYSLDTDIFRKDFNIVRVLPKAIYAVQELYQDSENEYIYYADFYANEILENTHAEEWSLRYFAAQVFLDLYQRTNNSSYLKSSYAIINDNVTHLIGNQRELNETYLKGVKKLSAAEPDYEYMTDSEQKEAKAAYKAEKERIESYNEALENIRKTDLPSLYEPLVLNCDLLFALADEIGFSEEEKARINNMLNGVFLSKPISEFYSFDTAPADYSMKITKDELIIPADLLIQGVSFNVIVTTDSKTTTFDDWKISEVERKDKGISSFYAHVESETMSDYKWSVGAKVLVQIDNGSNYPPIEFSYIVTEYKDNWPVIDWVFHDTVKFEEA